MHDNTHLLTKFTEARDGNWYYDGKDNQNDYRSGNGDSGGGGRGRSKS